MRSEATAERISLLHEVAARARPVALAREHVLPVLEPLQTLLPDGLRRGSTVAVGDSTSLALALLAGPSGQGSWAAAVGVSNLTDSKYYTQAFSCSAGVVYSIYPEAGRAVTASLRLHF